MTSLFKCVRCGNTVQASAEFRCGCGGLFEVHHEQKIIQKKVFGNRTIHISFPYNSGVWRYKELIHPDIDNKWIVSRPEGNTNQYKHRLLCDYSGLEKLSFKHEGENPTGSFKDRGMTVALSEANRLRASTVACASTGNTSASMAAYAAQAGMKALVFIPEGEISYGKLSQAIAYGAHVIQVKGSFDDAMLLVEKTCRELDIYLLNSINPWRIEGQKSIIFELLQQRKWAIPNWIIVPAGNLGNTSAFGKALVEANQIGIINKLPRIASIQAEGANPFYKLYKSNTNTLNPVDAHTIASAIKIGNPVSWEKAIKVIKETNGVVEQVSDQEIMDAKGVIDRSGIGCEPASAASLAGVRKLCEAGVINSQEDVVCILTGNLLKDSESTIHYHMGELKGITPKHANKPVYLDPKDGDMLTALKKLTALTQ